MKVQQIEIPPDHPIRRLASSFVGGWKVQRDGREFSVLMTRDDLGGARGLSVPDERWHLSIAGRDMAVPAWADIAAIAHEIRPGVPFVLGLPPKSWWVNVHPGTLHLWETKDENLVHSWRQQRRGDQPT